MIVQLTLSEQFSSEPNTNTEAIQQLRQM